MINSQTTTVDFLNSNENIDLLFDLIIENNTFKSKDLLEQPFQNVMDIINLIQSEKVLEAVCLATGLKQKKILKSNCNDFLQYVKWLISQTKIINNLFNSLSVDSFDKESMMLNASGVERLNKYNEIMIYYNIDKRPSTWKREGKMPFATVFTKLSIDKDISEIQKNYNQMLKQKNK
jgi:hypothetical protein